MKKMKLVGSILGLFLLIVVATLALLLIPPKAHASTTFPDPEGFVTDKSGLLGRPTREALENKLQVYRDTTSIEIAVLIVPTLDGMTLHDYADVLWKKWGIGKKGQDNGVLLLVVPPPEKQAWVQTGYGIQGWLTDVQCAHIVSDVMKPLNLQDKRPEAVVAGVEAIISKLGATPWVERAKMTPPKDDEGHVGMTIFFIVLLVCLLLILVFISSSGGSGYYGGSSGGGGWSSSSSSSDSGGGGFGGGSSGGGGGGGGSG